MEKLNFTEKRYAEKVAKAMKWLSKIFKKYDFFLSYREVSLLELFLYGLCEHSEYFNSVGEIMYLIDKGTINSINSSTRKTSIFPPLIRYYFPLQTFYRRYMEKEHFKENKNSNKILVPICGKNYISPVKEIIKKESNLNFLLVRFESLFSNQAKQSLDSLNFNYKIAEKYLDYNAIKLIKLNAKVLTKKWNMLITNPEFKKQFTYKDIWIWPFVKNAFEYFSKRGFIYELLQNIECIHIILKKEKPKVCILLENVNPVSKILIFLCKLENISTLYLSHSLIRQEAIPFPFSSDKIAVWGRSSKNSLIKTGTDHKKIEIVGNPQTDFAYKLIKEENIIKNKKIIVLVTNRVSDQENIEIINATLDAVKDLDNVQLIIKPHPIENEKLHKRLVKAKGSNAIVTKNINLYKLFHASDLVINYYSTVGVEAMVFNKPVITINLFNIDIPFQFVKSGATLEVKKKEDLKSAIEKCLYDKKTKSLLKKNQKKFVKHTLYKVDGKSADRVIKLIKNLIS